MGRAVGLPVWQEHPLALALALALPLPLPALGAWSPQC